MAFVSQERKAQLAPSIKAICKKYGVKATLGVHHHSTLQLNIKSSPIDFIGSVNRVGKKMALSRQFQEAKDSVSVNPYWFHEHFDGEAKEFLAEVITAMNVGNHDNSDIQSDYFDVGWYISVDIGRWNKPYKLVK
jgi:hypothetical protein